MKAHITDTVVSERRAKGRNSKPFLYLMTEVVMLILGVAVISFAKIPWLTVLSAFAAIFFFIMSCLPRYKKVRARQGQESKRTYNDTQKSE